MSTRGSTPSVTTLGDGMENGTENRRARTIAVASGKGGVGKTCIAISLAATLAGTSRRVLLVDGDLGLANVDVQLGLTPDRDLGDLIDGRGTLRETVTAFAAGGFDVLPGRAGSGALSTLPSGDLEALLLRLSGQRDYDVVIVDLGAGVDRMTRRMACWAETLVVIATDEPTSLADAYVVLKLHAQDKVRLATAATRCPPMDARVVVNQAATHASGERTFATLARVCQRFLGIRPEQAGIVRQDACVPGAIRSQKPLPLRFPASAAAQDIARIAAGLESVGPDR